jgi:peptidoglycan hydrolase CwlO-like protein
MVENKPTILKHVKRREQGILSSIDRVDKQLEDTKKIIEVAQGDLDHLSLYREFLTTELEKTRNDIDDLSKQKDERVA